MAQEFTSNLISPSSTIEYTQKNNQMGNIFGTGNTTSIVEQETKNRGYGFGTSQLPLDYFTQTSPMANNRNLN